MTISIDELDALADLACLNTHDQDIAKLAGEINSIMDFVQQLKAVDTTGTLPLFHPMDLHQRLRNDEVTEEDCLAELAAIAPCFDEHLFLVPKVIDTD